MNPSATAAAPRAEHDALDASPRVPTTYLTARSTSARPGLPTSAPIVPTSYFLQWRRTPSAFLLQNSGKTAAASLRRTPRAFLTGGTLVVRVDVSTTRLQIGIVRPVYRPYLWTLPRDAGHSLMVK